MFSELKNLKTFTEMEVGSCGTESEDNSVAVAASNVNGNGNDSTASGGEATVLLSSSASSEASSLPSETKGIRNTYWKFK